MLSIVKTLKEKLAKTRNSFVGKIAETLSLRVKVDESLMDDLEEILLQADIGPELSMHIIDELRETIRINSVTEPATVQEHLLGIISKKLVDDYEDQKSFFSLTSDSANCPKIILIVGVNGTGKTTSIGKIAKTFKKQNKTVLLVAADTFRAAAIEQLTIWAERSDIPIFKKEAGTDPSSVIFDGLNHAKAKNIDIVLIDTAGRQHNKVNLMNELSKIGRTIKKVIPEAPDETLLVLDSTTGQNAISQAHFFNEIIPISGVILTKFDGTAKGGIVIAIKNQLNIPVKLIGIGETIDDLKEFNVNEFADALFH
ncbi:MAG: signal recognition particle-docking protein FtsY [Candidatus Cloacimonetes bacterium]|nr:signal recognition particle-docking protein FtsY [Candidatus Cloacimonadota bacterium]